MYEPVIAAACREDPKSLQCAQTTLDVQRAFLADERAARNEGRANERRKPVVCARSGTVTVCN